MKSKSCSDNLCEKFHQPAAPLSFWCPCCCYSWLLHSFYFKTNENTYDHATWKLHSFILCLSAKNSQPIIIYWQITKVYSNVLVVYAKIAVMFLGGRTRLWILRLALCYDCRLKHGLKWKFKQIFCNCNSLHSFLNFNESEYSISTIKCVSSQMLTSILAQSLSAETDGWAKDSSLWTFIWPPSNLMRYF